MSKKVGHPGNAALGRPTREKHSPTLAPGTKERYQRIARDLGLPGWGYAVDAALPLLEELIRDKENE